MRKSSGKAFFAFIGGLSWGKNWLDKKDEEVVAEMREVALRNGGKGVILAPGCAIAPHSGRSA